MIGITINNKNKEEKNKKIKEGKCIFPFKYKHKLHDTCFSTEKGDICATEVNKNNTLTKYGYCKKLTLKKKNILSNMKSNKTKTLKIVEKFKSKSPPKSKSKKAYNDDFIEILEKL